MQSPYPVAITPLGLASAATVLWRSRGKRYVTAIVKTTFAIVPEGRMSPLAPDPIALDEQPDPSGRGLRTAGDLAPYLRQSDVLLTGHAQVPHGYTSPELNVWLAVVRDGQMRIDKRLVLDASMRVGPSREHVHIDGMGPLSREWPKRAQLLHGIDPQCLKGTTPNIPEGLDWTYFQASPADQRMDPIRGDEWLVLGGIFARRPKLRTELPQAGGVARLYRRTHSSPRAGEPIQLVADTLSIDVDRHVCTLIWRGYASADEADLAELHVLAGVELPEKPLAFADPFARVSEPPPSDRQNPLEHTVAVDTEALVQHAAEKPVLGPLRPQSPPPSRTPAQPVATDTTKPLDPATAARLRGAPATPFEARAATPPPPSAVPDNPLEGTMALTDELAAKLAQVKPMPFAGNAAPPPPPRPAQPLGPSPLPFVQTGAPTPPVSHAVAATPPVVHAVAPAVAPARAPTPSPVPAPVPVVATGFVPQPPPPVPTPIPVVATGFVPQAPPPALQKPAPPPTPVYASPLFSASFDQKSLQGPNAMTPEELAAWPEGLGADFLAAMAEAGALS